MFFWSNEYTTREHILEQVEWYRHSDVGKVLWAVNYGDIANYPSEVAAFWAADHNRALLVEGAGTTPYIRGQKGAYDTFVDMISSKGIIPQEVIAENTQEMGTEFDIMFRLGITRNSCMYGAPVTIALVPLTTMPLAPRSTTCT